MSSIKKKTIDFSIVSNSREELFEVFTIWMTFFHSTKIHFSNISSLPRIIAALFDNLRKSGNIGVDAFLILSGVGLYYSMSHNPSVVEFYKRRFRVLFPTVFIGAVFWFGMRDMEFLDYCIHILLGGVFKSGETYFWYFTLLCILYLIYPLIWKLQNKSNSPGLHIVILIAFCIVTTCLVSKNPYFSRIEILVTRIPGFLIGCWLGEKVYHRRKLNFWIIIGMIIILFPLFFLYCTNTSNLIYRYTGTVIGFVLVLVLSALFSATSKNLIRRFLKMIGNYSMEFYIFYTAVGIYCAPIFNIKSVSGIGFYIPVFVLTFILAVAAKSIHKIFWVQWDKTYKDM